MLETAKSERKKKNIAEEFRILVSTISSIIKNNKNIDLNCSCDCKMKRDTEFLDIEVYVIRNLGRLKKIQFPYNLDLFQSSTAYVLDYVQILLKHMCFNNIMYCLKSCKFNIIHIQIVKIQ